MPDGISEYTAALLDARRRYLRGLRDRVIPGYHAIFAQMLLDIAADRRAGLITSERAEALAREIRAILATFTARIYRYLASSDTGTMAQVAQLVAAAHQDGLAAAASGASATFASTFERVPERAIQMMYARSRAGGLASTFRSLFERHRREMAADIDRFLMSAVGRGLDAGRAAHELAVILARGDDALLEVLQHVGPRGGRLRREIGAANREAILAAAETGGALKAARELLFRARRIVIHETNQAHVSAHLVSCADSPAVALVRWTLSGRHAALTSSPDVCDVLAAHDAGYGPGLYRPEVCPTLPHPYCGCTPVAVLRPASQWRAPKPEIVRPAALSLTSARAMLERQRTARSGPITPARVRAAAGRANQYTRAAYEAHVRKR